VFASIAGISGSLLLGFAGAWVIERYAFRFGMIDIPNDRSSHSIPTPRGAGVGILAALAVSAFILRIPLSLWLPAVLLSLISFFDDKLSLSCRTRLMFQITAALVVVWPYVTGFTFQFHVSPFFNSLTSFTPYLLIFPLCIFVVGTANFFNFMDGINGIAGITGAVGFGFIALFAHMQASEPALTLFAAGIAAACVGFLPMNIPRARVFMGDVGSILLGFIFAALSVVVARSLADFLVLCGFLFTFYADALTTFYIRWQDGDRLSEGHRRHLYQILANQMRIPHWKVSLAYGLIQAAIGGILFWLRPNGLVPVLTCELLLFSIWCWAGKLFRLKVEH
jgi:Fuc2NAc and GlcNAc transferase